MSDNPDMMHLLDDDEIPPLDPRAWDPTSPDLPPERETCPVKLERMRAVERLREERERIERRVYDDQQRLRVVYETIAAEVTALAEGR